MSREIGRVILFGGQHSQPICSILQGATMIHASHDIVSSHDCQAGHILAPFPVVRFCLGHVRVLSASAK
jgi:hypothetical protein